jgi:hypothetical protein
MHEPRITRSRAASSALASVARETASVLASLSLYATHGSNINDETKQENDDENDDEIDNEEKTADDEANKENVDPQPRKKRKRVSKKNNPDLSDATRRQICDMYDIDGKTAAQITQSLQSSNISTTVKTVQSVISLYVKTGRIAAKQRHPPTHRYSIAEEKLLVDIQQQYNDLTYDELRQKWREATGSNKKLSNHTIHRIFVDHHVTTKNLEHVPEARNSPELKLQRKTYCEEAIHWERSMLIFIDETGFHLHLHRRRGRSIRGTPAVAMETNNPGTRLNICAAVSPIHGLLLYRIHCGSWDQYEFRSFISDLMKTDPLQLYSHYIVLDNVKWHYSESVMEEFTGQRIQHEMKRLPPYSPHLNPIEYCFSRWKQHIKRERKTDTETLRTQINTASKLITPEYVSNCLDRVYKYYPLCIRMEDLTQFKPVM